MTRWTRSITRSSGSFDDPGPFWFCLRRADTVLSTAPGSTLATLGLTKVTTKLTNLADGKNSFESPFLADAEATDSIAPSDELQKLGIKEEGKMAYELADGTIKEYSFGLVRIESMGGTTAGRVSSRLLEQSHSWG